MRFLPAWIWRFLKFCAWFDDPILELSWDISSIFFKNKKGPSWGRGVWTGFHSLEFRAKERRRMRRFNEKPARPLLPKKPGKPRRKDNET